jgi:hypothetical protein
MDDKLNEILDRLPPKRPRSRLDAHAELIDELRRRGRTYREIARVLAENCQVQSAPSNIYYFVQLRAREAKHAKARQAKQIENEPFGTGKIASTKTTVLDTISQGNLPTEIAQRIAALKQRKFSPPSTPSEFNFDPDEPLRLITGKTPSSDK